MNQHDGQEMNSSKENGKDSIVNIGVPTSGGGNKATAGDIE